MFEQEIDKVRTLHTALDAANGLLDQFRNAQDTKDGRIHFERGLAAVSEISVKLNKAETHLLGMIKAGYSNAEVIARKQAKQLYVDYLMEPDKTFNTNRLPSWEELNPTEQQKYLDKVNV